MVKIMVKKINKIDAIFNNVIHIFYHKKYKKEEEIRSFVFAFYKDWCIIDEYVKSILVGGKNITLPPKPQKEDLKMAKKSRKTCKIANPCW